MRQSMMHRGGRMTLGHVIGAVISAFSSHDFIILSLKATPF